VPIPRKRLATPGEPTEADRGAGLLATLIGVMVFLVLLLVAVQVLYNLYATSAVTAATYDGARIAAGYAAAGDPRAHEAAAAHVKDILGAYGDRVELTWIETAEVESLTVRASNPSFLPRGLRGPLGLDHIERTVRVRIERETPP